MKYLNKALTVIIIFLVPAVSFAYDADDALSQVKFYNLIFLLILILSLGIGVIFYSDRETGLKPAGKESLYKRLKQSLTRTTPLEKEKDIMMDHEYDGIRELDNAVPPWLNYIFIFTFMFSIFYIFHYHVFGTGKDQIDEYTEEMNLAHIEMERLASSGALINEENVTLLTEDPDITKGKILFGKDCTPCHGMNAEGTIGPNLTDNYWIHGGDVKDLFKTVKNGVPEKGMISWKQVYNPRQIQEVISYIISINGTNPPNGKKPEGEFHDLNKTGAMETVKTDTVKIN